MHDPIGKQGSVARKSTGSPWIRVYWSPVYRDISVCPNIRLRNTFTAVNGSRRVPKGFLKPCNGSTYSGIQCFFFSRNIGKVTPKMIYFYYLKKYFPDQSIQKTLYLILKTAALQGSGLDIWLAHMTQWYRIWVPCREPFWPRFREHDVLHQ